MGIYSADDFKKAAAAEGWGVGKGFSQEDWNLAMQNPDAGMSLLSYKKDWVNAKTPEARALANEGANKVRSGYGNYTAGKDGMGFYLEPLSPYSFNSEKAPAYENRYDDTIQDLLGQVVNRKDFSYDPETDPLYSQYRKQYAREGKRATEDAMGAAAAASGGLPSSFAATAAAQAGNYYSAQMTDKIPELYQLAYNKYLSDHNAKLQDLSAVQNAEQMDYGKFQDQLQQYNTDRQFNYGMLLDEIESQRQERAEKQNQAILAAEYGDYKPLNDMGVNTDNYLTEWQKKVEAAQLAAEFGDFSKLRELGITPDAANLFNFNSMANKGWVGSGGGSSGGSSGGRSYSGGGSSGTGVSSGAASGGNVSSQNGSDFPTMQNTVKKAMDFYGDNWTQASLTLGELDRAQQGMSSSGIPTTHDEFVAMTGSVAAMTQPQFMEAKARNPQQYSQYSNYKDYLAKMYRKYA